MFHTLSTDIFEIADKLKREADAEKRKAVQEFQQHQLEEEDAKHKQQAAEELAWAKHLDADVKKWQHAEAEKNAKKEEATSRLKARSLYAFDFLLPLNDCLPYLNLWFSDSRWRITCWVDTTLTLCVWPHSLFLMTKNRVLIFLEQGCHKNAIIRHCKCSWVSSLGDVNTLNWIAMWSLSELWANLWVDLPHVACNIGTSGMTSSLIKLHYN